MSNCAQLTSRCSRPAARGGGASRGTTYCGRQLSGKVVSRVCVSLLLAEITHKKRWLSFGMLAVLGFMGACSAPPSPMRTFYGNVATVVAGVTTQADVQRVFGIPQAVLAESTSWVYSYPHRNRVSDPTSGYLIASQQIHLSIRFDDRGIVKNIMVMVSEIGPKPKADPFPESDPNGPIAEPHAPTG